ncbi:hypothetical protein CISG_02999 [Coccidioides immitis RMSCC 3703]|uniref:Uncharacterized protein n=1 Tax=Coccidioides immitis RMSCC 3703 TaxID=454286 RepID=A0A0J8QIR0_COCIT|nr:hypothetical protein CISG_02999 [Coccidioides immitis RMSCC 3703]
MGPDGENTDHSSSPQSSENNKEAVFEPPKDDANEEEESYLLAEYNMMTKPTPSSSLSRATTGIRLGRFMTAPRLERHLKTLEVGEVSSFQEQHEEQEPDSLKAELELLIFVPPKAFREGEYCTVFHESRQPCRVQWPGTTSGENRNGTSAGDKLSSLDDEFA